MKKKGFANTFYFKIVLGAGLGAYIGYSILNSELGVIVGLILGGYLALKL